MPQTPEGHFAADTNINIIDTWKELEKLYDEGKVRLGPLTSCAYF